MAGFHLQASGSPRDLCMLDDASGSSSAIMMDPGPTAQKVGDMFGPVEHVFSWKTPENKKEHVRHVTIYVALGWLVNVNVYGFEAWVWRSVVWEMYPFGFLLCFLGMFFFLPLRWMKFWEKMKCNRGISLQRNHTVPQGNSLVVLDDLVGCYVYLLSSDIKTTVGVYDYDFKWISKRSTSNPINASPLWKKKRSYIHQLYSWQEIIWEFLPTFVCRT